MGVLSLLPDEFGFVEVWLKRLFILLGIIIIGPWVFLLIYDLVLYIARYLTYEIPVVGGRARGNPRPRAPSLTERPSGHRRSFSLARRRDPPPQGGTAWATSDASDPRWRKSQEDRHHYSTSALE